MLHERRRLGAVLGLLLLGAGLLAVSVLATGGHENSAVALKPGATVAQEVRGGETHRYCLSIAPGHAFRITLDPHRNDLKLSLLDPFHAQRLGIDTRHGLHGPETLYAVADLPGDHVLEIRSHAPAGRPGSYRLNISPIHPVSEKDRLRQRAMAAFSRGENLFAIGEGQASQRAADEYAEAIDLWLRAGEPERATATRYRRGRALEKLGGWKMAQDLYQSALVEVRLRGDRLAEAFLLDRIGRGLFQMAQPRQAAERYRRSLDLFRQEKYPPGEADALNDLGLVYNREGNFPEGIKLILRALEIWEEQGGVLEQVYIRQNLGELHLELVEPGEALHQFERALELSAGQKDLVARAVGGIGTAQAEAGRVDLAIPRLQQAVGLWRDLGDRQWEVATLIRLGDAYTKQLRLAEARTLYERALVLSQREPADERLQAMALGNLGHVLDLQGQKRQALGCFEQARLIFQREGDHSSVAKVLFGRAEVALGLGDLDAAREAAAGAIAIVELLRSPLPTDFSLRRSFYELYIEILMRLHEREPDRGFAIAAFNAAEAARSRSLLDDVKELAADSGSLEPSLLEKKAVLEKQLKELELKRWELPQEQEREDAKREALDREARDVETELAIVRAELEKRGMEGSPRTLTLPEVQGNLGPDTVLLAYFLGQERSFLWEITPDRFLTHQLPGRFEIETQAKKVLRQLARSSPREWQAWMPAIRELSGALLSQVASRLEDRQLLISPDGALYLVPFAALLDPRTLEWSGPPGEGPESPRFLVLDHRIVTAPSVSVVTATREALAGRARAPEAVAILADPVFDARHPRSGLKQGGQIRNTEFQPLPFSLQEAEAIVEAVRPARSFLATGFRASHATAIDPALGRYNVIHFATHGWLRDRPDLSGIVLSLLDERGVPQDGFLRAFEIYDLELSSDLVVLSACETALGGEKGGLVRAFLHAGSRRVMATLWPVQDRSTALLMGLFYQDLLRRGLPPAEALQQAQIDLLRNPRWKAPHYWAGFALHGDWR